MKLNDQLRELAKNASDRDSIAFGWVCCWRLISVFPELNLKEILDFCEFRATGPRGQTPNPEFRRKFGRQYDKLYPGYGDPSPSALALSAVGELAFTESALDAAINALEFAAEAIAKRSASAVNDSDFDVAYDTAYAVERSIQFDLMTDFFGRSWPVTD